MYSSTKSGGREYIRAGVYAPLSRLEQAASTSAPPPSMLQAPRAFALPATRKGRPRGPPTRPAHAEPCVHAQHLYTHIYLPACRPGHAIPHRRAPQHGPLHPAPRARAGPPRRPGGAAEAVQNAAPRLLERLPGPSLGNNCARAVKLGGAVVRPGVSAGQAYYF